jgi:hypothetical protein
LSSVFSLPRVAAPSVASTLRYSAQAVQYASSVQRSMAAGGARYTAIAAHYAAPSVSSAARYLALAAYHAATVERIRAADAARYPALAEVFSALESTN